eukprot:scaffold194628_cov34-Cyclotella_meneghiniana.AAC.4
MTLDVLPELRDTERFQQLSDKFALDLTNAGRTLKNSILDATKMNVDGLHQRYLKTIAMGLPAMAEILLVKILLAYYNETQHGSHRMTKEFIGSCEVAFCANFGTSMEEFGSVYKKRHDFNMVPPPTAQSESNCGSHCCSSTR